MSLSLRSVIVALGVTVASAASTCCYSKWGDKSSCGDYPASGHGGLCSTDWTKSCTGPISCPAVMEVSVYWDQSRGMATAVPGATDPGRGSAAAHGVYTPSINQTGWDKLHINALPTETPDIA